jgi:hypothetical protein
MPTPVPAIAYVTCHAENPDDLDMQVTTLLSQRWSLWGNPYVMPGEGGWQQYCQAMIQLWED